MSHSRGRQQKNYFPLSQCFPELQMNSASTEFSEKDYSDYGWSGWVVLPELNTACTVSQILTLKSKQNLTKNMFS